MDHEFSIQNVIVISSYDFCSYVKSFKSYCDKRKYFLENHKMLFDFQSLDER